VNRNILKEVAQSKKNCVKLKPNSEWYFIVIFFLTALAKKKSNKLSNKKIRGSKRIKSIKNCDENKENIFGMQSPAQPNLLLRFFTCCM
jgi:hypothetical protein